MNYSLDYKIGQMVMTGFSGANFNEDSPIFKAVKDFQLGNIWLSDMSSKKGNIESPEQLKNLVSNLNALAAYPLLISIDAEGGQVIRLKEEYGFPATYSAWTLGQKNDPGFTFSESRKIAKRLRSLGINLNLTPVIDLKINPFNPSLAEKERCFSDDPEIVYTHAREVIEAHHEQGILCCLKHFPGHGSTAEDSHLGFVDASATWRRTELEPYVKLLKDNLVDAIISAHIMIKQFDDTHPASLSGKIINGLLRTDMGYDGVVISDDLQMGAIQKKYTQMEAIELAINAGVDILLYSNMEENEENLPAKIIKTIKQLYKEKRIRPERIDQSFRRIIKLKTRLLS